MVLTDTWPSSITCNTCRHTKAECFTTTNLTAHRDVLSMLARCVDKILKNKWTDVSTDLEVVPVGVCDITGHFLCVTHGVDSWRACCSGTDWTGIYRRLWRVHTLPIALDIEDTATGREHLQHKRGGMEEGEEGKALSHLSPGEDLFPPCLSILCKDEPRRCLWFCTGFFLLRETNWNRSWISFNPL